MKKAELIDAHQKIRKSVETLTRFYWSHDNLLHKPIRAYGNELKYVYDGEDYIDIEELVYDYDTQDFSERSVGSLNERELRILLRAVRPWWKFW